MTGTALHKAEMEYHGKIGLTLGRIKHIFLMSRIDISYTSRCIATQTVAPTLPGFQCIKHCIKCLASHPNKTIFYTSNYYYGSNVIRHTGSGNKVED